MIAWHRLLGMTMTYFFKGSCFKVETEVDLSLKAQLLDLLLVHKTDGVEPEELPDGLDDLARYNLITYKSMREPLDSFAIHELMGHYINCRKIFSVVHQEQTPEGECKTREVLRKSKEFVLFGLTTAYPRGLAKQTPLKRVMEGVYDIMVVGKRVRIIVLSEIADAPRNGLWNLFSARKDKVVHGAKHLDLEDSALSSIINELLANYHVEGINMPYTMEDFQREAKREVLARLTPRERVEGLTPEQRTMGLPPEQLASQLTPEQRIKGLPAEQRIKGFTPEQLRQLAKDMEDKDKGR